MDGLTAFYHVAVAVSNLVALIPLQLAFNNDHHLDFIAVAIVMVCSIVHHLSPIFFPKRYVDFLWADRIATVSATVYLLYRFYMECPRRIKEAYMAMRGVALLGLFCLFVAEVLFRHTESFIWCISHGIWHICSFLTVYNLQTYIYSLQ